ncbi:MAG: 30S ribosomal protein S12 methylthiotransferase RimO [Candidatus Latescibacterota bacterium]|nr:30S ribosomal protein S12 methylthiotransferase RimO [Candidatus Latescibacterota bacterium]
MTKEIDQKVHLVSLGCPKNTVDSERMLGLLDGNSYQITEQPEQADVVIVNTCGFIGPAKEESIDAVMAAHRLKEEGKCRGVIVTGCLATRYEEELRAEMVEADALLTIDEEFKVVERVDRILNKPPRRKMLNTVRKSMTPDHWSYLRISDGCDHKCAFCAIPAIRGPHKSEAVEDLLSEAERLSSEGVRELVLISQDSVRYGADLYGRPALVNLLGQLEKVKGIEWIRLMYTYPAFWTEEMIDFFASSPKMCAYIDMPLQHISDSVLQRMKRATTRQKTIELLQLLRARIPGVGLRSTFIVGFPGETDGDFEQLLEFVEETRFDHLSGFIYSPEEGTSAYGLDAEVAEEVKQYRYSRLTQLQERIATEINDDLVGSRHIVLVDDRDEMGFYGRMQRDAPEIDGQVFIEKCEIGIGQFVEVEITGADPFQLHAHAVGVPY